MSIYGAGSAPSTSVYSPPTTTQQANLTREAPPESSSGNPSDVLSVIMPLMTEMMKAMMQALSSLGQESEQTSPERASTLNYDDNGSINQRLQQLAEGEDPLVQQLMNQLINTPPESPETQQIQARLGVLLKDNPEKSKEINLLTGLSQLNNLKGSLNAIASNLDPNSPEYQENRQRLQSLEVTRQHIIEQLKQGEAEPIVPNLKDNGSIGERLQQLTKGDPELNELMNQAIKDDNPESPETQNRNARIAELWKGSPKELDEFFLLTSIANINYLQDSLKSTANNLAPEDPQNQQIQARLEFLSTQHEALSELWNEEHGPKK